MLCEILGRINTEVIYIEMWPSYFDHYNVQKPEENLESKSILVISKLNEIILVPVNSDKVSPTEFVMSNRNFNK